MRVQVQTELACSGEQAWKAVQTSALLRHVTSPLVTIRSVSGELLPENWPREDTIRCRCFLFGAIPLGTRRIYFERVDGAAREIQTRETDPLVRRWDHLVQVRDSGPDSCLYSDDVIIEAGCLTPLVWLFASFFYRHRQWRCRRLAPGLK